MLLHMQIYAYDLYNNRHNQNLNLSFNMISISIYPILVVQLSQRLKTLKICGNSRGIFPYFLWLLINPFVHNAPFIYPLKTSEKFTVFSRFQGVLKEYIGSKWVDQLWQKVGTLKEEICESEIVSKCFCIFAFINSNNNLETKPSLCILQIKLDEVLQILNRKKELAYYQRKPYSKGFT